MRALPLPRVGLRVRLVVAFTLVAAVATLTTGALTFREARTGVLQQSQDSVIEQFREHVNTLAPEVSFPPAQPDLHLFATGVANAEKTQNWRVLATYRDLSATSDPGDRFQELTPDMREAVRTRSATVFQRVGTSRGPALVVGLPVTFGPPNTGSWQPSGLAVFLTVP
ncbi:MAG TPA: two-component sensor histidine kinase, partial [Streptomyces sp.]